MMKKGTDREKCRNSCRMCKPTMYLSGLSGQERISNQSIATLRGPVSCGQHVFVVSTRTSCLHICFLEVWGFVSASEESGWLNTVLRSRRRSLRRARRTRKLVMSSKGARMWSTPENTLVQDFTSRQTHEEWDLSNGLVAHREADSNPNMVLIPCANINSNN